MWLDIPIQIHLKMARNYFFLMCNKFYFTVARTSLVYCNYKMEHSEPWTKWPTCCGLRMSRECRERFPRHCGLATPTCITTSASRMPGSFISGFLCSRWGKRSRYSRRMRNPQFCISGKRPIVKLISQSHFSLIHILVHIWGVFREDQLIISRHLYRWWLGFP